MYRPCQLRAEKVTVHFRKRALRDAFVARAFSFSATDISKILKKCTLLRQTDIFNHRSGDEISTIERYLKYKTYGT